MWNRRGERAIDLLGTTPRMPEHDAPPPAASRAGLWSSLGGAIFIAAVPSLLGGPKNGGPAWRWLSVMGYSGALAAVLRFARQA